MTVELTINKFIRDNINLILNISEFAILGKQNAPRPTSAYATVSFLNMSTVGTKSTDLVNNPSDLDLTETIKQYREYTFSVNFYRLNAIANSELIRLGFERESIRNLFYTANLGLTRISEIRDLSDILESKFEERSQMDITISALGLDSQIIKSIQSVDIAAEYQARNLRYNFIIGVS